MNWPKIYFTVRTTMIMGGALVGAGGFYAVVVVGICRLVFKLEDNAALWIGVASFFAFMVWGVFIYRNIYAKQG